MASETLPSVSPQTNADSHSLTSPSSSAINNSAATAEAKKDPTSDKISRNSSSGEEDGNLVIDTDDDSEKVNKEIKPFFGFQGSNSERKSPVRNNNNNNSVGRGLCNMKHTENTEKESTHKSLSTNIGNKMPSFSPYAGFSQSSKLGKSKSKKSSKANKSNTSTALGSNSTSVSSPRASSPAGSFINALDTDSNQFHNFDSKILLPRASSSPDENAGKKVKTNKSKSHHKKQHSKHLEKSSFLSSGNGGKSDEKIKSKSKHSNANISTSAFSLSPEAPDQSTRIANNSPARSAIDKPGSSSHLVNNQRFTNVPMPHSATSSHRIQHLSNQGRVPARTVSIAATTGNGAKGAHACNEREASENEVPTLQHQVGRKKHKKSLSAGLGNLSSRDAVENLQSVDCYHQPSLGKRDRGSANSSAITSGCDGSKSKRMKHEQDAKSQCRISNCEVTRTGGQSTGTTESTSPGLFGTVRAGAQVGLRAKNGEIAQTSAGHCSTESGAKTVAPRVFAPSHFAHNLPLFNVSNPAEINSLTRSKDTGSNQSVGESQLKSMDGLQHTETRTVGTITSTSDIGVMTEPDSLGPCEPGTSVHLDGIVWHETDTGVLVVNVTWRNRTYIGTLLDATKHDWAPPRFSDSDLDMELRGKSNRPKRTRAGQSDSNRKGRSRGATQSANDDIKNSPSAAAKRRNKNSESEVTANADIDGSTTPRSTAKKPRLATPRGTKEYPSQPDDAKADSNGAGSESSACSSPMLLECPQPNCSKKYKNGHGLKYHQSFVHGGANTEEPKETNSEETGMDATRSSPEEATHDTPVSDTEPGIGEEDGSMKHPLAHLVDPEDSVSHENNYHKKKSFNSKEENKSLTTTVPKSYSKEHTEFHSPQQGSYISYSAKDDKLKLPTESSSSFTSLEKASSTAALQKTYPICSVASDATLPHAAAPISSRKEPLHQHLVEADMESEQAVKTLLQLQDTAGDYSTLPGLSASYNQDSPHPTLSLGSRSASGLPQQSSAPGSEFSNRTYQNPRILMTSGEQKNSISGNVSSIVAQPMVSSSSTDTYPVPPNYSNHTGIVPPGSGFNPPIGFVPVHQPSKHQISEIAQIPAATSSKETYTVSVSNATPAGPKIAKGKTVPIPLDPDHSIPSSYAGTASLIKEKKMKRKKKPDGKSSTSPESSPINEISYPPMQEPPRFQHSTTEIASLSSSNNSSIPPLNTLPTGVPAKFPPVNAGSESSTPSQLNDPSRRMHPQHHIRGKVRGMISPVSTSQGNNVTVTGTFHPHPDPHKPQTAVSAQAQDRVRSNRPSSPNSSSNKNNNNKLGPIPTRNQNPAISKSMPSSTLTQTDKPAYYEQEACPTSRPKGSEMKAHSQLREVMQNQVESTIASAYSKELSVHKAKPATSPIPTTLRPRDSPNVSRESSLDTRPISVNDDAKVLPISQKVASKPVGVRSTLEHASEAQKSSPSPRSKSMAEIQHLPSHQQAGFMPPYGHPMYGIAALQYIIDPTAREQFVEQFYQAQKQFLQPQAVAQQVQTDKSARRPEEKEALKPPCSPTDRDQSTNWQLSQQGQKRAFMASPSPYQQGKEKPQNPPSTIPSHAPGNYRSPQTHPHLLGIQDPTRCHSAAPTNPPHLQSRPQHHTRSESLDRGRSSVREERRASKPAASPTVKVERSPEKPKESYPSSRSSPAAVSAPLSYYQYLPSYPGVPHYAGIPAPHGYLIHPGAASVLSQPGWLPGHQHVPVHEKQPSPLKPSKDNSPNRFRSPSKEDSKPLKEFTGHYNPKERNREAPDLPPDRKYSISPDAKSLGAPPVSKKSVSSVASEIPTQMHHHTHHHIHGLIHPPYFSPGTPAVLGGPDAVPHYPVQYPKRE